MPLQVPGNEKGTPQADDGLDLRVPVSPRYVRGTRACEGAQTCHRNPGTQHAPVPRTHTPTLTCPQAGLE